ncbi:MAG TPA: hypothetical protein PK018_11315 [Candidatus Competibacter sp.]|nr:hypothetical protein [Candidatus Competibacteraceae bacterium]HPE72734.1 hypothetical protein [Candidatus Competibacter sp.]HRW64228.1 hypothetical protein [Candidatus Competibacter sp.]
MVREFKKIGAAAAVAGALLASSASYATVQLSAAGDILLVPYVTCDLNADLSKQKNTLIGLITFWKTRLGLVDRNGELLPAPAGLANVRPHGVPTTPSRTPSGKGQVHWYFYNTRSEHELDGVIDVTDNDFVRFDWCSTIKDDPATVYLGDGKHPGYMLFVDNTFDSAQLSGHNSVVGMPEFALYGHAYQVQGNWASQAFVPVVSNPVCTFDVTPNTPPSDYTCSGVEGQPGGFWINVVKDRTTGYPHTSRLVSGIDYTNSAAREVRDVYLRYFLDPALATANLMVFWFNTNASAGTGRPTAGETYNSQQVYQRSFTQVLPDELNLLLSTPAAPKFPGMIHEEDDDGFVVKNTGIIRFGIPEVQSGIEWSSSGVVFNMLGLGAGDNASQLQTEMATEGSEYQF